MTIKLTSNSLTKNLARRTKLVHHLDAAFSDFDDPFTFDFSPKETDDAWHPSGDCTPSVMDLYDKAQSKLAGDDPFGTVSVSLRKTFLVGHFWHALLQHILVHKLEFCGQDHIERKGLRGWGKNFLVHEKSEASYQKRLDAMGEDAVQWYPFHWATGSADVAPCTLPKFGDYLIDFKTMNAVDFSRNYPPEWAVHKWECQTNIYMDWFDLEHALIVGVQKDSPHNFKEFEFHRNQPLIDVIYDKWQIVSDSLDEGKAPDPSWDPILPLQGVVES